MYTKLSRHATPFRCCALAAVIGIGGCSPGPDVEEQARAFVGAMGLEEQAAQLVMLAASIPNAGAADAAVVSIAGPGGAFGTGIWIESGEAATVAHLAHLVRERPGIRPLIGADLNEGVGGVVVGATSFPPMSRLIAALDGDRLAEVGNAIASEARVLGIDLGLIRSPPTTGGLDFLEAPLEDLPERAGRLVGAFERQGIRAVFRMGWGGPPDTWSDWDRARLEAIELPILDVVRRTATALSWGDLILPALGGDTVPLYLSRTAIGAILRRDNAWDGVVVTDLRAGGGQDPTRAAELAIRAVMAGSDLVIVGSDPQAIVAALVAAAADGRLSARRIGAAAERIIRLKLAVMADPAPIASPQLVPNPLVSDRVEILAEQSAESLVLRLTDRSLPPVAEGPVLLLTPVDRGGAFAAELERSMRIRTVTVNTAADPETIADLLVREMERETIIVYLDFPATTSTSLADVFRDHADLIDGRVTVRVAFRRAAETGLLADPPDLLGWGLGSATQRAAAQKLVDGEGGSMQPLPRAPSLRDASADAVGMSDTALQAVDAIIGTALEREIFTAAAVAVGRRGGLVRLRGYGSVAPEGAPVDPSSTLFDVASLTKVVGTTTAAAILVDAGAIDLDAPVQRYLPEFRGDDKERVTIRHLLAHSSGLPPGIPLYGSSSSRDEALDRVIRQPLRRPPGEVMEYSDLGMILLAEVIERAAGESIDRLLAKKVFVPLEMGSTMYLPPLAFHDRIVPTALRSERPFPIRGVVHDGNAFRLAGITGHAGLFSTAADLAVFAQTMLNRGVYGPIRILADSTVRQFTERQPDADTRALGWDTPADRSSAGIYFSRRSVGHTGYTGTSIWLDPEQDLFVVLLTNRTFTEASATAVLDFRRAVHDAVARAIVEPPPARRAGAR
jgi:CubicO group peptidase (beta-lactamase class C family)/beta-glucosidase-like glycosyl hydrolase